MKNIATFALLSALSMSSQALNVANIEVSDELAATDETPSLKLNGAALRELYLLIETYVGALYLESPSADPQVIINSQQHKRMEFHVLMKKVSARRLSNALHEALLLNISKQEHKQLQPAIETMLSFFEGNLRAGDKVVFEYQPGLGTKVQIGKSLKGTIAGKDFYSAMLKIWVGESPVSREFKEQILGSQA